MVRSSLSLLVVVLSLIAVTAAARPCKTLFFYSATTTSTFYPLPDADTQNPNFNENPQFSPRSLTFFFTSTNVPEEDLKFRFVNPRHLTFSLRVPRFFDRVNIGEGEELELQNEESKSIPSIEPLELYSSVTSSIRDRTKDIMSVVGALLFGVGCGALTAATMYLLWSLFMPHRFDFYDSDDDFDEGDDDVSPKKMGYTAIPSATDDDLKKPAPAKEVA